MSVVYGMMIFNPEVQVVVAHGRYRRTEERRTGGGRYDVFRHVK